MLRTVSPETSAMIGELRAAGLSCASIRFELANIGIPLQPSTVTVHAARHSGMIRSRRRQTPTVRNGRAVVPYSADEDALIVAGELGELDARSATSIRRRAETIGVDALCRPAAGVSFRRVATGIVLAADDDAPAREIVVTTAGLQVWRAIEDHIAARGVAPSYAELAARLDTYPGRINGRIRTLVKLGVLGRSPRRWRGLSVLVASPPRTIGADT